MELDFAKREVSNSQLDRRGLEKLTNRTGDLAARVGNRAVEAAVRSAPFVRCAVAPPATRE
jgi:hypothetical protein